MSNSKKVFTKNKIAHSTECITLGQLIRRYKSEDVYIASSKKTGQSSKMDSSTRLKDISISNAHPNLINTPAHPSTRVKETPIKLELTTNSRTSLSIPKGMNSTSSQKSFREEKEKDRSPVFKKNNSDINKLVPSKMSNYLSSKPRQNRQPNGVTKIMNEDSIQELDTEENINSIEEEDEDNNKDLDEMKSSQLQSDFYTNSISESMNAGDNRLFNRNSQPLKNKFNENVANDTKNNPSTFEKSFTVKEIGKKKTTGESNGLVQCDESGRLENLHRALLLIAKKGDREEFHQCLESLLHKFKGDINFKDESGWTALHFACDEGNLKIVEILIKANADVNVKTMNNKTPLHISTSHGYFDISKLLIENGAIINSLDDEKNYPIHLCASGDHIELLKYLLDRFPEADSKNIYGKTPIDLAQKDQISEVIEEYLKKRQSQYHKVKIHTANIKQANSMLKDIMTNSHLMKTPVKCTNLNLNVYNTQNEEVNINLNSKLQENLGTHHSKFQSNDFHSKGTLNHSPLPLQLTVGKTHFHKNNLNLNVLLSASQNMNNGKSTRPVKMIDDKQKQIGSKKVTPEVNVNNETKKIQAFTEKVSLNFNSKKTQSGNNDNLSKLLFHNTSTKFNIQKSNYLTINHRATSGHTIKSPPPKKENIIKSANIFPKSAEIESGKNFQKNAKGKMLNTPLNLKEKDTEEKKEKAGLGIEISLNDLESPIKSKNISSVNTSTNRQAVAIDNQIKPDILPSTNTDENAKCESEENFNFQNNNTISVNATNIQNQSSCDKDNENSHSNLKCFSIDEETVSPSSFICHALIGKGSFGEVYLVEKKSNKTLYAMKVLSKDKIMGQNLVKYAMTERNVLSITNHPFIVKLNFAFQTTDKLFLILDYCPGGDLAEHLSQETRFKEDQAKIYLCEIILALEDLHKRDIIFRDLKPDNVVLDANGHAMLTDFGLSKEGVFEGKCAKSFCGSIAYLAPEMLNRKGHGKAVDWYLLGVLFYEMLVGIPPYFTDNKYKKTLDYLIREQIFKNIESGDLQIPKFVSEGACKLLKALLQRDPNDRLGSGKDDSEEIKSHPYFSDINWNDVSNRKLRPHPPKYTNSALQHFSRPRVFSDDPNDIMQFSNPESHFDGWSFIYNEDKLA